MSTMNRNISERDYYYDNLKGLLIFLVVFAHLISEIPPDLGIRDFVYNFIYMFHMPLFVLVSGFFSKRFKWKSLVNLVLVYLLWQIIIYPVGYYIFTGNLMSVNSQLISMPKWTYWYLLSLITWKMMTAILPKSKWIFILVLLLSFVPGLISDVNWRLYSLGRTIGMFPFFYLGYLLTPKIANQTIKKISKPLSIGLYLCLFIAIYILFIKIDIPSESLYFREPYVTYLDGNIKGLLMRAIVLALAFTSILAILPWIPKKETILCRWGQNTLPIYLTHGFLLASFIKYAKLSSSQSGYSLSFIIISLIFSYGYCQCLTHPKVTKWISYFTNFIPRTKKQKC